MTPHKDAARPAAAKTLPTGQPHRSTARQLRIRRLALMLTAIIVTLAALTSGLFYALGILTPFARITTLAELSAPLVPAAYAHLAVDASDLVWVAQSAPGLAGKPTDHTLLTIVDPNQLFGDRVLARLCLGCAGVVDTAGKPNGLALARIDDIAPDPQQPHSVYLAGWTAATTSAASQPVVLHMAWHAGTASCAASHPCATVGAVLTPASDVTFIGTPAYPNIPLIQQLLSIGVVPVLSLATVPNGDLYCFLSDRGRDGLGDPKYDVIGGFQTLLRFDPLGGQWAELYVGPAGSRSTQHLSPTSTVAAIAVDRAERYLYLADADHQTILRMDLRDPQLASASPFTAAGAVQRWAGQALAAGAYGDVAQGVPGWTGDGSAATQARLNGPRGLAFDAAGNLLVLDAGNGRLRLITPQGTIWTVAGRGAATVDGDNGSPLDGGLRGALGLASDSKGRVFVTDGAALDAAGHVPLRRLDWGWSTPAKSVARVTRGGQSYAGDVVAGLVAQNQQRTTATVLTAGGCQTGCLTPYLVAAGGALPDQAGLALPQALGSNSLGAPDPITAVQVPGTDITTVANGSPGELTFADASGCCASSPIPAVALPAGAVPTGLAVLAPTTATQVATLNAAYLFVPVQDAANGPALLIYKAAPQTCAAGHNDNCANFPGAPTLAATVPFPAQTALGAVAVAMSDDAKHAFALVALPMDNQVSAIDLTGWLAHGASPQVTARVAVNSPAGMLVMRHDAQAAYISAGDGQLAVLATSGWLSSSVPANLTNASVSVVNLGDATTLTAQLALAGDDTRLFAALQTAAGATTLVTLDVGQFDQPAAPTVISRFTAEAHLAGLTLTDDDARLLALSAPNGVQHAGTLRAWATRDPTNPTQWLTLPLDLGMVPTGADPRAVVGD